MTALPSTAKIQIGTLRLFLTVFGAALSSVLAILAFGDRLYVTPSQWEASKVQLATLVEQENNRLIMLKDIKDEQWLMRGQINAIQIELARMGDPTKGGK